MKTGKESQNLQIMQLSKACLQLKAGLSLCENYKKQLGWSFTPFSYQNEAKNLKNCKKHIPTSKQSALSAC